MEVRGSVSRKNSPRYPRGLSLRRCYMHVPELRRMGVDIKVEGRVAIVKGSQSWEGASVEATDLRAGAY